jgi:hypothetical protein
MDTNTQVPRVFANPSLEPLETGPAIDLPICDADAVRHSESNILQWMKYLPEDCIHRMIQMGWDVTT